MSKKTETHDPVVNEVKVKDVYTALLHVYSKVGYVFKGGTFNGGKSGNYSYASEADLIEVLRPAMIEAGLIFFPIKAVASSDVMNEVGYDGKPKTRIRVVGSYTYRFVHAESGTSIDVESLGEGIGNDDKGSYKAATGAMKYALRQSFVIQTGDDPDKTPEAENRRRHEEEEEARLKAQHDKLKDQFFVEYPIDENWVKYCDELLQILRLVKTMDEYTVWRNVNKEGFDMLLAGDKALGDKRAAEAKAKYIALGGVVKK